MLKSQAELNAVKIWDNIKYCLGDDLFDEVPEWLRQLGTLGLKSAPFKVSKALLQRNKQELVREMLKVIMHGDDDFIDELDFEMMIRGARLLGLDWPELDVMQRSIRSELHRKNELDEDRDDDGEIYGNEWRAQLEFNEHLSNLLDELKGDNPVELVTCLKEMGYLEFETVLSERSMSAIKANKHHIIRSLLECMKSGEITRIGMTKAILALNNIGINWPELEVIWKSLMSELSRRSINEDDRYQRQMMWDSDWLLSQNVLNGNYWAVSTAITDMTRAKVNDADINSVLAKHRENIISMQETMLKSDSGAVRAALSNIRTMMEHGIEWPELREMIETQKQNIMYCVLHEIAHENYSSNSRSVLYSELIAMGIEWPELGIIKRSLESQPKGR